MGTKTTLELSLFFLFFVRLSERGKMSVVCLGVRRETSYFAGRRR